MKEHEHEHQHEEEPSWEETGSGVMGDRIVKPEFDPGFVLMALTVIGILAVGVIIALSGCAGWECEPRVTVGMAPPTPGKDAITSYGFGVHCEQSVNTEEVRR